MRRAAWLVAALLAIGPDPTRGQPTSPTTTPETPATTTTPGTTASTTTIPPATATTTPQPLICTGEGCTGLTYGVVSRFAEAERVLAELPGSTTDVAFVPIVPSESWSTIAAPSWVLDKAFTLDVLAADAALTVAVPRSLLAAVPELSPLVDIEAPPPPAELLAPRGELAPVIDLTGIAADPPDDRAFLDVVLVGTRDRYHCTGVLVAPDAVLTAAHCAPADRVAVGQSLTIIFARVKVTESVIHPTLDAALLRLARPLPVPVRNRRRAGPRPSSPPVGLVRVIGFGVDDLRHPNSFGVKRRADVSVSRWGCDRSRARVTGCRPAAEMVLTAVGGGDTCRGDSGGPVLEPIGDTFRLLAITSRATASGGAVCGRGGIYVRVDVLDAWLTSTLEKR